MFVRSNIIKWIRKDGPMKEDTEWKAKKYKIAAIYGSPRKDGNTAILMDQFLKGVEEREDYPEAEVEIKKILVSSLDISPCRECCSCSKTGECIILDDMQDVYKILLGADFIAVASPIFFTTVSGYLKALIDRCQRLWVLKYEHNKRIVKKARNGIFISTSGSGSRTIFECSRKVIRSFFDVLFVDYFTDFVFNNMDKKGDILKDERSLSALYEFGKKMEFFKDKEGK